MEVGFLEMMTYKRLGQKKSWSTKLIKEFLDIESWIELLVKMDEVVKPKGKNGRPKGLRARRKS
jgi:hypothetical protein